MRYLFIDGGCFQKFTEEMAVFAQDYDIDDTTIKYERVGFHYDRVFYYDGLPEKKDNQSEAEFEAEIRAAEELFHDIGTTPNFNVRPALTRGSRRRRQKGVDVLLAIECFTHALRNNVDEATVMTSDLDLYPLFEALLQTRTKSQLLYQRGSTSPDLIQSADQARALTGKDYLMWIRASAAPNQFNSREIKLAPCISSGTVGEWEFELRRLDTGSQKGNFAATMEHAELSETFKSRMAVLAMLEERFGAWPKMDT